MNPTDPHCRAFERRPRAFERRLHRCRDRRILHVVRRHHPHSSKAEFVDLAVILHAFSRRLVGWALMERSGTG